MTRAWRYFFLAVIAALVLLNTAQSALNNKLLKQLDQMAKTAQACQSGTDAIQADPVQWEEAAR